jgi:Ca2+-binding RTX toxin-like protein
MAVALLLSTGVALAAAISGTQGNDTLRGTRRADQIYGLNGRDTLKGFAGGDELYGGAGLDRLVGSGGNDEIYGGNGQDKLLGGNGADYLNSADGDPNDTVDCGNPDDGATDRVVRDVGDMALSCNATEGDPMPETS